MKIITTAYFKDFARYILFLENEINVKTKTSHVFYNVSIYPCAHNYYLSRRKHSVYLPFVRVSSDEYKLELHESLIEELICFNKKSLALYGKDFNLKLRIQAVKYLNILDGIFKNERFDYLISSGDSRLLPMVTIYLAKKYNVKIIFFEQGPFNTTIFDKKGVNANISFVPSFRKIKRNEIARLESFKRKYKSNNNEKYWTSIPYTFKERIFNIITLLLLYPPFVFSKLIPADLQIGASFSSLISGKMSSRVKLASYKSKKSDIAVLPEKYIALFLQVPVDAQLIEHSPYYKCFYKMVKDVINALPDDYMLVVREHPQYKDKYDPRIYKLINMCSNVLLGNHFNLNELIVYAEVSVLNNSAVGIESLLLGTKVVTLGNSYYSGKGVTFDFNSNLSLEKLIKDAIHSKFHIERTNSFLYEFIFEYLCEGHFQDLNLVTPRIPYILRENENDK